MNLGKQLTIEGFITDEKSDLDRFREWWSEKNKKNADHFPMRMTYGDWYEHFSLFICEKEDQP